MISSRLDLNRLLNRIGYEAAAADAPSRIVMDPRAYALLAPVKREHARRVAVLRARRLGLLVAICRIDLKIARLADPAAKLDRKNPVYLAAKAELERAS